MIYYTNLLPIIVNYVNQRKRHKHCDDGVCAFVSELSIMHTLYMATTTRFHAFSKGVVLYIYVGYTSVTYT